MLPINIYQQAKASINSNKLIAITIIFSLFSAVSSRAQILTKLQNSFNVYQQNNLQEKIYVHTNKSLYLTGEILWFKIYNAEGSTNKMLNLSKVAYVDLIDNNHTVVMQTKILLKGGIGSGSLYLPVSLTNGNYQLRAYTSWMKNYSADYFFEKKISIVNPLKTPPVQAKLVTAGYDIQFFPEGGHLVSGLISKVAYKITGADGKGLNCTGAIINQQNDTVAHFNTLKFGIGSFLFTPLAHTVYKAIIKVNNSIIVKELPEVSESGYVMQVTDQGESWDVAIQSTNSKNPANIYLLVHSGHMVKIAEGATLANGSAHLNIGKRKLDDGLSYITLFDDQQRPLCERLVFKRPAKKLLINAQPDAQRYSTRKKVSLTISTGDQDHKTIPANLSVSVFRADTLQNEDANHIASYLWLNADLKGHIESADYYLENTGKEADEALDNLMLSQGWTQFDWTNVLTGNTPRIKFLPEYTGHIITGRIANNKDNTPAKNVIVYLSVPGTRNQMFTTKSDSIGRLLFNTHDFYGSGEIIVQTNTLQDSTYHVDIVSPFAGQYAATSIPAFTLTADMEKALADNSFNTQVQNIFTGNQLKQFYDAQVDSTSFYGTPTKTYKLDDYTRFTTMEEVLREYVGAIALAKRQGKFSIRMFNDGIPLDGKPLVMLDGTPVFDADKIFSLDPLKVKKLDLVTANYLYGPVVFNGIMSFTTYKGDMSGFEIDPHAVILDYEGLQLERKFYSPVYDSDSKLNSPIPDFRNVLYWNPEADTNQEGKNNLSFYTSDKPGLYIGVIEGTTVNGEAGSQHFTFEVKK
jgi:hypothetical protein